MNNRRTRFLIAAVLATCGLALPGCLTPLDVAPTDTLDEHTGNTYTSVAQPLIFARRRADIADNAREYATVAAAHLNRAGQLTTFLLAYRWATVELRPSALPLVTQGRLSFSADGRAIELRPLPDAEAATILQSGLAAPRTPVKVGWVYDVDATTLLQLANAQQLQLTFPDETTAQAFDIFSDGRSALEAFARQ